MTRPRRPRPRGGKGGAEPRVHLRRREQDVVDLSAAGYSQHAIARQLSITQSAVSQILHRVDERWAQDHLKYVSRQKAVAARKFDHLYREAMQAWEASKTHKTRRRQRKTDGTGGRPGNAMAEVVVEDSHGDPRYLDTARRALADRDRLRATPAPAAPDAEAPTAPMRFTLDLGPVPLEPHDPDETDDRAIP